MTDVETLGPISDLIVENPENKMTGKGVLVLWDLVDQGLIGILDLLFVTRDTDGSLRVVELRDLDVDRQIDVAIFEGVSSGLLDDSDLVGGREPRPLEAISRVARRRRGQRLIRP